jgi:predicted DNA-binding transcriptional regulator YafY
MARQRPDADRRVRQCERLARVLRLLRLLLGHGRWNADALARELGCSVRTLFRDLNALTMSGVPVRYDRQSECYSVPEGYRFPRLDRLALGTPDQEALRVLRATAERVIADGERLLGQLRRLCEVLRSSKPGGATR